MHTSYQISEFLSRTRFSYVSYIIISDRRTKAGKYKLEMGTELKGKTLGVIGLGSIGSRVAELGKAVGMKVIACFLKLANYIHAYLIKVILSLIEP